VKTTIEKLLSTALDNSGVDAQWRQSISVERARDPAHGDFSTNAALVLAKPLRENPRALAAKILAAFPPTKQIGRSEIAGPGFINFFLSPTAYHDEMLRILKQKYAYGRRPPRQEAIVVEFVSANPTGPLHVGHGRGAAVGDCISRLLEAAGWQVQREFYYNDAGQQIRNLALSVQSRCRGLEPNDPGWPPDGYRGEYVLEVARAFLAKETVSTDSYEITGNGDPDDLEAIRRFSVAYLRHEQDLDLRAFNVHFDTYYLESSLYTSGKVEEIVTSLITGGYSYERDGALWLRTTAFGDDKDRVMRKSDGNYTYFVPDVAYHVTKWERGFHHAINGQGADHHSTITRVRAGLQALNLGIPAGWPEYVLHQMVTVTRGGTEVKISKRAGNYVTLRELIDEVGTDATRYFLLARKPDSQLIFDIDLARSQTNDNPVYYIQYAHARIVSVFRQMENKGLAYEPTNDLSRYTKLAAPEEITLLRRISRYPEVLDSACTQRGPHILARFLGEVAQAFHAWYNSCTFLVPDPELRNARLALARATRHILANGLGILGISAPERM